jgi:hypothetical protein
MAAKCEHTGEATSCMQNRNIRKPLIEIFTMATLSNKQKQTPWPLVRERTIPTERPPLVDEI